MNARLRAPGVLGKVLDAGADGSLAVVGRSVSWTQGGALQWSVAAAAVHVEALPSTLHYDLVLRVGDEDWPFIVDDRPIRTFTRGLLVARRRRDAAITLLRWIEYSKQSV